MSPPLELDYIGLSPPVATTAAAAADNDLNGTELRLGLPGSQSPDRPASTTLDLLPAKGAKRGFSDEAARPPPSSAADAAGKGKKVAEEDEEEEEDDGKKVAAAPQAPAAKPYIGMAVASRVLNLFDYAEAHIV
uniref:Auxin-responsive protein n=1 Tax=Leersia perrieri TaxID=77586 RepID=A0A0D9WE38_9ORYZ